MSIESGLKFVTFNNYQGLQIIVFPREIQHKEFADSILKLSLGSMQAVSGGFVLNGECVGESTSLNMKATKRDTELLKTSYTWGLK